MMLMKRTARGAKRTIWRREFMATRMAQYSLSPPARLVQTRTCVSRDGNVSMLRSGLPSHSSVHEMGVWRSI